MPNRYEREIEEILRNLEHTEPKPGLGQRFGERLRRRSGPRMPGRRRSSLSFNFSTSEWLLIVTIAVALVTGGYAYILQPGTFTGIVASIGFVCLVLVALSQFLFGQRRIQSARYGNVTITPLRRSPFSSIKTKWNLLMLKVRYRRKNLH